VGQRTQDYKCPYTAVTICATLFVAEFDLSILTPLT